MNQNKTAEKDYPIHELLEQRWSPRTFAERAVEREKLMSLFEAARWAPSSFNEQPWRFLVATKDEPAEFERMLRCLAEANQSWARHTPVLLLTVASLNFSRNAKPNRHALHDVGLAVANLTLQATSMDLSVHQMAGFDSEKARDTFHIPNDYEPVTMVAIGYRDEPDGLPDGLQKRESTPRTRKLLGEIVFAKNWGRAFK